MINVRRILIVTTLLLPIAASAACWDGSQQAVDNCTVTSTASGATSTRTLKSRFADVVNVKDFGAYGDDSVDDTAHIQAAINSANGTVFFPEGTYLINDTLRIEKPVVLLGVGTGFKQPGTATMSAGGSVILGSQCGSWVSHPNDHSPMIRIRPGAAPVGKSFSGVTVQELTLDGGCSGRSYPWEFSAGIEVQARGSLAPQNVHLRNLHIRDVSGDGITIRGTPEPPFSSAALPSEVFIEENFIERWHKNRQGVAIVAGSRVIIANNQLVLGIPTSGTCPGSTSSGTDPTDANFGIDLETNPGSSGSFVSQVQISGNLIHNCNGGINVSNSSYPNNAISNVAVHGNTVQAYGAMPLKPMQYDLSVAGISNFVEYNNRNDDGFQFYKDALRVWSDGTLRSKKGAYLSSAGVWTNASSREYKQDIRPLENALDLVRQLQIYEYRYRSDHGDDGRRHVGVIAEELPEAVASADHKGAPTAELIALSLAANRALLLEMEAQATQLEALQAEIAQLKKKTH